MNWKWPPETQEDEPEYIWIVGEPEVCPDCMRILREWRNPNYPPMADDERETFTEDELGGEEMD